MKKYGRPVLKAPEELKQFDGKVNAEHQRPNEAKKEADATHDQAKVAKPEVKKSSKPVVRLDEMDHPRGRDDN